MAAEPRAEGEVDAEMQDVLRMRAAAGYATPEDQLPVPYVTSGEWSYAGELPDLGGPDPVEASETISGDLQDLWRGAVGGVPVSERSAIAAECVVGEKKKDAAKHVQLVKGMPGINQRLLRTHLSHLMDSTYDVGSDVIRPHGWKKDQKDETAMAVEVDELVSCAFRRRESAQQIKAHVRRRHVEDEDSII
ncbi:unnamed protein product [Symbiodinium natans]|uniref:Uncharacterized protein n=1 Tax=Symbiodinium natans TaxID=878477 RepID=A0A812N6S6_9DINO|nr:unnamed protein product [Symbiodinium natans]